MNIWFLAGCAIVTPIVIICVMFSVIVIQLSIHAYKINRIKYLDVKRIHKEALREALRSQK